MCSLHSATRKERLDGGKVAYAGVMIYTQGPKDFSVQSERHIYVQVPVPIHMPGAKVVGQLYPIYEATGRAARVNPVLPVIVTLLGLNVKIFPNFSVAPLNGSTIN